MKKILMAPVLAAPLLGIGWHSALAASRASHYLLNTKYLDPHGSNRQRPVPPVASTP